MNLADGMGRLSARIRLPWEYDPEDGQARAWDVTPDWTLTGDVERPPDLPSDALARMGAGEARERPVQVTLAVCVEHREGETLDAFLGRARAAVVELLGRIPAKGPLSEAEWGMLDGLCARSALYDGATVHISGCRHLAHRDPRAGKAGRCPDCGAVIGGET